MPHWVQPDCFCQHVNVNSVVPTQGLIFPPSAPRLPRCAAILLELHKLFFHGGSTFGACRNWFSCSIAFGITRLCALLSFCTLQHGAPGNHMCRSHIPRDISPWFACHMQFTDRMYVLSVALTVEDNWILSILSTRLLLPKAQHLFILGQLKQRLVIFFLKIESKEYFTTGAHVWNRPHLQS